MFDQLAMLDVGDGLCTALIRSEGSNVVVDWGSQGSAKEVGEAWHRFNYIEHPFMPNAFVLSHYHTDHYNGLGWAATHAGRFPEWRTVTNVYGPGLPEIPDGRAFYRAYFAMSFYMLGAPTGLMEIDILLSAVSSLASGKTPKYTRLFQGDHFTVGAYEYECIWPPRLMGGAGLKRRVASAIKQFESALNEEPALKEIYDGLGDSLDSLLDRFRTDIPAGHRDNVADMATIEFKANPKEKAIPKVVRDANEALKRVANELSLGFREGARLAFLGDIDRSQLTSVVDYLEKSKATEFGVIVAPHHGTMWHKSLMQLRSSYVMVSIGNRLWRYYKEDLRRIGPDVRITRTAGDIVAAF